jgi:hypothetical protein
MAEELTESKIQQALGWVYERALNGGAGIDSAKELADDYIAAGGSKIDQVDSLIRWQNAKAGTSGFLTGLGGVITLPIAIPANITSVMFLQVRMIAAIAHIAGYDIRSDQVKTLIYACLAGNGAKDILKDVGLVVGRKLTENAIKGISGKTIIAINQKVGFRLLTKFGSTGAINLGKAVPLMGGLIGLAFDATTTNIIGNTARDMFLTQVPETEHAGAV